MVLDFGDFLPPVPAPRVSTPASTFAFTNLPQGLLKSLRLSCASFGCLALFFPGQENVIFPGGLTSLERLPLSDFFRRKCALFTLRVPASSIHLSD